VTPERIERLVDAILPRERVPQANAAAASEVLLGLADPAYLAAVHEFFQRRWSPEFALLVFAIRRGLLWADPPAPRRAAVLGSLSQSP
jgi:hypothetical protein